MTSPAYRVSEFLKRQLQLAGAGQLTRDGPRIECACVGRRGTTDHVS